MEIIKINKNEIKDIDLPERVNEVYLIKNNLEIVGYGFIDYGSSNEIEVFIKEDYRGNGYGKELFKCIYNDFTNSEIKLEVDYDNHLIIRIIEKYRNLNLGTNDGLTRYVLKKD